MKPLNLSDVRNRISQVFTDAVVRHRPVPIARGGKQLGSPSFGSMDAGRISP